MTSHFNVFKQSAMCCVKQTASSSPVKTIKILVLFTTFCFCACNQSDSSNLSQATQIKFDKQKWNTKIKDTYLYRKQMAQDVVNNYSWKGVTKDSLIQMLGEPDNTEEGLAYYYEKKPVLGGLATRINAIVFELSPGDTVKLARFNNDGWD